jgi:acylphosphatase
MKIEEEKDQIERLHAQVIGRVQGVGFRAFVQRTAVSLDLNGWVRNRWDGSVEVVIEGDREVLQSLLAALWRGPRSSYVVEISTKWEPALNEFSGFSVRPTA